MSYMLHFIEVEAKNGNKFIINLNHVQDILHNELETILYTNNIGIQIDNNYYDDLVEHLQFVSKSYRTLV